MQTLNCIFYWFHLLRSNSNRSRPPNAISYLTLLTNQLCFSHTVNSQTLKQLIRWVKLQCNTTISLGKDIQTFDSLWMVDRQDINNLQQDIRTIKVTNLSNKQQINDFYDSRDNIRQLWALIVLLEGQNKVYQAQIS